MEPTDIQRKSKAILEVLEAAFQDVIPPDADDIIRSARYHYDPERQDIAKFFRSRRWQDISIADLRRYATALAVFSAAAYRYFLPAFMSAALRDVVASDTIASDVVWSLSPRWYSDPGVFFDRVEGMSPEQANAIRGFLEWLRDCYGVRSAEIALEDYWSPSK